MTPGFNRKRRPVGFNRNSPTADVRRSSPLAPPHLDDSRPRRCLETAPQLRHEVRARVELVVLLRGVGDHVEETPLLEVSKQTGAKWFRGRTPLLDV